VAWLATTTAALPVMLGFVAPATYLVWESSKRLRQGGGISPALWSGLGNTLALAAAATLLTVAAGLVIAWAARRTGAAAPGRRWLVQASSLGYALPGTVLAIGLLAPMLWVDASFAKAIGHPGLPMMASGVVLLLACGIRFLAISIGGTEAGLARIPLQLEQAARTLGESAGATLRRVHLPLLRPAMAAAALLVFVDAMKELPVTLLLRPANFDTLATLLYAEAARGTYEEGALAALAIVLAGVLPVIWISRTYLRSAKQTSAPSSHD
jgi:iron(III) transport system permease protein